MVVLVFRGRDSIAAMVLRQPIPGRSAKQHADAEESVAAVAGT